MTSQKLGNVTQLQSQVILQAKAKVTNSLALFRPTEQQEAFFLAMEKDDVLEMLLGGGNRGGKSLSAVIYVAAVLLNQPVTFRDGSVHHMRPKRWRNEALKVWIVGYDWKHIGKTIFRLMFVKDLFRIIRDQKSGKWRAWNPDNPGEREQYENTRPAPPLIRYTDIVGGEDGMSWENKKAHQFDSCDFIHDGTRLELFPSTGAKPQGDPAHLIWVDEKIEDESWYGEFLMRLPDRQGRLMWTAWPDTAPSDKMSAIEQRAKDQNGKPGQFSYHIILDGSLNPYTKNKTRDNALSTMDEDERLARDRGIMNNDRWKLYPLFSKYRHRAYGPDPQLDDKLAKAVRNGIPQDWTRYVILDPGTQHPFVLFVAVPPPAEFGDYIVPYDEISKPLWADPIAQLTAAKLGITPTSHGDVIEELIADFQACRQTPMGFAGTIGQNYEKYFAQYGIRSRRRGSRFTPGDPQPEVRRALLRDTMKIRQDGTVQLRIVNCPTLIKQLESAKVGKDSKGNPTDEPAKYYPIDGTTCLEYLVSRKDCGYFAPPPAPPKAAFTANDFIGQMNTMLGVTKPKMPQSSVLCGAVGELIS